MEHECDEVAAFRRFTRFYTRQTELLDEGLLDSRFSLTEARVLYELAHRADLTAGDLARELGLDAGYLSRILKRFVALDLLARETSHSDGRQSRLTLTAAGHAAFAPLDRASARQVADLVAPLPDDSRRRLAAAMATIETLLATSAKPGWRLRPHRIGDVGMIAARQGCLYAQEYGWDATFEALVAEIAAGFVRTFDPARERAWIAETGRHMLGSVLLVRESDEVAKLRLLYVEPEARGLGIGARLVDECIGFARERGYRRLTLWTNDCLTAALHIYVKAGFQLVEEERHRSFGHDLVGQYWALEL